MLRTNVVLPTRIAIAGDRRGILYTPPADFGGLETFVYAVDGEYTAQVRVNVQAPGAWPENNFGGINPGPSGDEPDLHIESFSLELWLRRRGAQIGDHEQTIMALQNLDRRQSVALHFKVREGTDTNPESLDVGYSRRAAVNSRSRFNRKFT